MKQNPFYLKPIPAEAPICNRISELKDLTTHARNKTNLLLYWET